MMSHRRESAMDDANKASARVCCARRTTASCAAAASSSPTSVSPACRTWRSCAARWRTRASAASLCPTRYRDDVFIAADLDRRQADPRGHRAAGLQGLGAAGARHRQGAPCRRARRHVRRADARRGRGHRRSGRRSTSKSCPPIYDMLQGARAGRAAGARALGRQRLPRDQRRDVDIAQGARRADQGDARDSHRAAMHGAARRPRRRRDLGSPASISSRLFSLAQMPHIVRTGLAECLGLEQGQIRVVSPDVGGGFGYKGILLPEEVALAWLAMQLRPSGALDRGPPRASHRQRQLPRAPLHHHRLCRPRRPAARHRLRGDRRFRRLFGLSVLGLPGGGAGRQHPARPLRFPAYRCRTYSVATNKPPILPYRGVARTGVCFALELMLDAVAREAGIEPDEVRLRNLVRPEQMPFDNITKKHFDSGDYPEALRRARRGDRPRRRCAQRQAQGEPDGRRIGVGFAIYCEQAGARHLRLCRLGHPDGAGPRAGGRALDARRRAGAARRRALPRPGPGDDAGAGRARNPRRRHRQDASLVHGDTAMTPYSTGTWGSRCMVMAGGAVADRLRASSPSALRASAPGCCRPIAAEVRLATARSVGANGSISRRRHRAHLVSPAAGSAGRCRSRRAGGHRRLQAAARHRHLQLRRACRGRRGRSRDRRASRSSITSIVEDGGVLVNPMIVDGQIYRRLRAGHRHRAVRGDAVRHGRPAARLDARRLSAAGADRGAGAAPRAHGDAVALYAVRRQKGIGEGGAIAPPAAIANAVNDALKAARRRAAGLADHAAPHRRGDRRRRAERRRVDEAGRLRLRTADATSPAALRMLAERCRARRCSPAASRSGRCSICGWRSRRCSSTSRAIAELTAVERGRRRTRHRRLRHPRGHRGWPRAGRHQRRHAARVARGIAYRAVRNRGTIGGSLAHADPAADWVSCLAALGADVDRARQRPARGALPVGSS